MRGVYQHRHRFRVDFKGKGGNRLKRSFSSRTEALEYIAKHKEVPYIEEGVRKEKKPKKPKKPRHKDIPVGVSMAKERKRNNKGVIREYLFVRTVIKIGTYHGKRRTFSVSVEGAGGIKRAVIKLLENKAKWIADNPDVEIYKGVRNANKYGNSEGNIPVGICHTTRDIKLKDGSISVHNSIRSQIYRNGEPVYTVCKSFGKKRTKEEAIDLVITLRENWIKYNPE